MKDKRGFTLVELIVILGLAAIVISVVMSFFIANYKSYKRINTEAELQYQSQFIINFMTEKILEATEFEYEAGKYVFVYGGGTRKLTFELEDDKIRYQYDENPPQYIGNYVSGLNIDNVDGDTRRVIIELTLYNQDYYKAEQIVYMRNAD